MNEQMDRYPNPSEIRHRIGAQGPLTINNVSGEVEIRATDGDEVTCRRTDGEHAHGRTADHRSQDG